MRTSADTRGRSLLVLLVIVWAASWPAIKSYVGPIATAFAYWAAVEVGRFVRATTISMVLLAVPGLGLLLSAVALHESLNLSLKLGTLLIGGGIWNRHERRRHVTSPTRVGEAVAGFNGHTWGGCCELSNVWVDERYRGQGLGAALLRVAEAEAVARERVQIVLATHSFQAPGFYERLGFQRNM